MKERRDKRLEEKRGGLAEQSRYRRSINQTVATGSQAVLSPYRVTRKIGRGPDEYLDHDQSNQSLERSKGASLPNHE